MGSGEGLTPRARWLVPEEGEGAVLWCGLKSPLAWRPSQGGGTAERSKQHQAGRCSPHWPGSRGLRACPSDSSETPREGEFPKRRTCSLPLPPGSAPFLWLAPLPLFLPPLAFRSSPPLHQGWVPVYPRQASIFPGSSEKAEDTRSLIHSTEQDPGGGAVHGSPGGAC